MMAAPGVSGDLLRKAMAEGKATTNAEIYGRETMRHLLSEKAVVICELQSVLYLTSLMCRSTKQFFHVSSEGVQRVAVSIAIGIICVAYTITFKQGTIHLSVRQG